MITNPFARKPKSPVDQVLDVVNNIRADAAGTAGSIRDAATKAADALGDAAPEVGGGRRLTVLGVVAAGVAGVALAVKARAGNKSGPTLAPTPTEPPRPSPAAATAAKATAAQKSAVPPAATGKSEPQASVATAAKATEGPIAPAATEAKPTAEVEPEEPREPKAATPESDAGSKDETASS